VRPRLFAEVHMSPFLRAVGLATVLLLTGFGVECADAQQRYDRHGLTGVRAVGIVVETNEPEFEKAGLYLTTLQTDVELKLRQARISIIATEELPSIPGSPVFQVQVLLLQRPSPAGLVVFAVHTRLLQVVRLDRDPQLWNLAGTWGISNVGMVGLGKLSQGIREEVRDQVDRFLNDYLKANPQ
jgi:hypothetical protein